MISGRYPRTEAAPARYARRCARGTHFSTGCTVSMPPRRSASGPPRRAPSRRPARPGLGPAPPLSCPARCPSSSTSSRRHVRCVVSPSARFPGSWGTTPSWWPEGRPALPPLRRSPGVRGGERPPQVFMRWRRLQSDSNASVPQPYSERYCAFPHHQLNISRQAEVEMAIERRFNESSSCVCGWRLTIIEVLTGCVREGRLLWARGTPLRSPARRGASCDPATSVLHRSAWGPALALEQ